MKKLLISSMVAALFMADANAGVFSKLKDSISNFANKIGISNKTTVMDKDHKKQLTDAAQVFSKKVENICKGNSLSKEQKKTYGKDLDNLKSKMKTLVNFIKSATKASVVSQASIQSVNQITGEITSLTEFWAKKPEVSKLSEDFYYAIADLWTTVANFARKGVYSNHEVLQRSDEAISKIKNSTWQALYPGTNEPTAYIDTKYRSQVTSTSYRTQQTVDQSPAQPVTDKEQKKELDEAAKVFSKKVENICKGSSLSKEQKKAYKKDLSSLKSEIKKLVNFVKTAEKTAVVSQTSVQSINQITNEITKVTDFWAKKPGVSKLSKDFYYAAADLWLVVANLARKGVYSGNEVLQRSDEAISKIKNSTWQALHPGTTEPKAYIDEKYKSQVVSTTNAASQTIGQIETTKINKVHKKEINFATKVFSKKIEYLCKGESLSKEQKKIYSKDLDNLKNNMKTLVDFVKSAEKFIIASQTSVQSVDQITAETMTLVEFWSKKTEVSKLSEDFYYAIADLWMTVANLARKGIYSGHEVLQKSDEVISKMKSSAWQALYPGTPEPTAYIDDLSTGSAPSSFNASWSIQTTVVQREKGHAIWDEWVASTSKDSVIFDDEEELIYAEELKYLIGKNVSFPKLKKLQIKGEYRNDGLYINTSNDLTKGLSVLFSNAPNLEDLTINYGLSGVLTSEISKLKKLTFLDLSDNSLTGLPSEIGQLTNLKTLVLRNNKLTSLPNTIGNLKNLTLLDLSYIGQAQNSGNGYRIISSTLRSLPNEIGNLVNLTTLSLRENSGLTALPNTIGNLTNLTSLDLSGCKLTSLPSTIGNLTNLKTLNVGCARSSVENQLTNIPNTIGNLTNLTSLNLNNNKITILPQEMGNLVNLTSLSVSNNQLTSLPNTIGNLTKLTELRIDHNKIAVGLPEGIWELINITTLDVGYNQLTSLSNTIGNLTNLTKLYVDHNKISSIPNTIGNLKKLYHLNMAGNQLTSLPNEIGNLTNLQTLYIYDNRLTNIPGTIGNLTMLSQIIIDERGKKYLPQNLQSKAQSGSSITYNLGAREQDKKSDRAVLSTRR